MLRRVLLLVAFSLLLVAFRAPLRHGQGGFVNGLIREQLGKLGAAGKWVESSLQEQLLGKRVHYMVGEHSWSGKVTAVRVVTKTQPSTDSRDREVLVTVETMAGMGDRVTEHSGIAPHENTESDYSNRAVIELDQISGILYENSPLVGKQIKLDYDDVYPARPPRSPAEMFVRRYPNMIVAVYTDGYLEVDVTGLPLGTNPVEAIASGTVFIHTNDLIRDTDLTIVSSVGPENQTSD